MAWWLACEFALPVLHGVDKLSGLVIIDSLIKELAGVLPDVRISVVSTTSVDGLADVEVSVLAAVMTAFDLGLGPLEEPILFC